MSDSHEPLEGAANDLRSQANAWMVEFSPLVVDKSVLSVHEVHYRLTKIKRLQATGPEIKSALHADETLAHNALTTTFETALSQLESIENDLRIYLGKLAPGDPEGIADLEKLNESLQDRMARQEVGIDTTQANPDALNLVIEPGKPIIAWFFGIMTVVSILAICIHAIVMFSMAGGTPFSIVFMGFYLVAILLSYFSILGALELGSTERIELKGRKLSIRKNVWKITQTDHYDLPDDVEAALGTFERKWVVMTGHKWVEASYSAVYVRDTKGRKVQISSNGSLQDTTRALEQINLYFKTHR